MLGRKTFIVVSQEEPYMLKRNRISVVQFKQQYMLRRKNFMIGSQKPPYILGRTRIDFKVVEIAIYAGKKPPRFHSNSNVVSIVASLYILRSFCVCAPDSRVRVICFWNQASVYWSPRPGFGLSLFGVGLTQQGPPASRVQLDQSSV